MKNLSIALTVLFILVAIYFVFFFPKSPQTSIVPNGQNVSGQEPTNPCDTHDCIGK